MELLVERVDVWAAGIDDRPGALAEVLAALRDAGANLQFVVARRSPETPRAGVVFVTPLQGDHEIRAAAQVGFNVSQSLHSVRVMGRDKPGLGAELSQQLAEAGINLRGLSASAIGNQFIAYFAFDSIEDVDRAMRVLDQG